MPQTKREKWFRVSLLRHERLRLPAAAMIVGCTVAAAHWPAIRSTALALDDRQYLTENYLLQSPGWTSAWRFLTEVRNPSTVHGYYQPLSMISLMFDAARGGDARNLRPFHQTSLLLHVCNCLLLMLLVHQLVGSVWAAAGAALLFGVHPVTVEPVPWVGERKT